MRALVIGGTGPTGPYVVEGLAGRGYEVTVLHGGHHEVEFAVPGVRHIHCDPHFEHTLREGLVDQTFDVVVAQYGRLRVVAEVMFGRTGRLIAIGGSTGRMAGASDPRWGLLGRPAIPRDGHQVFTSDESVDKFAARMVEAVHRLFETGVKRGGYAATYLGYPHNYGPRQPGPQEWSIVRRVLDKRRQFVIADGGVKLESRIYTRNAANAVLLLADHPDRTAGREYCAADQDLYSIRQRIEFIAALLDHEFDYVDLPYEYAWPAYPLWRFERQHRLCDATSIRAELGYADEFSAEEGLTATVEWLLENRPAPGGEAERQLRDEFRYDKEDELISAWRAATSGLPTESPPTEAVHIYRHPKTPGENWRPGR